MRVNKRGCSFLFWINVRTSVHLGAGTEGWVIGSVALSQKRSQWMHPSALPISGFLDFACQSNSTVIFQLGTWNLIHAIIIYSEDHTRRSVRQTFKIRMRVEALHLEYPSNLTRTTIMIELLELTVKWYLFCRLLAAFSTFMGKEVLQLSRVGAMEEAPWSKEVHAFIQ